MNNDLNQNNNQNSPMPNQPINNQNSPMPNQPVQPNQQTTDQPKKNNKVGSILLIVLVVILVGVIAYFVINGNNKKPTGENNNPNNVEVNGPNNNKEPENNQDETKPNKNNDSNKENSVSTGEEITNYYEVEIDGNRIGLPASKEDFDKVGWEWDPKHAESHLDTGYTTSGGRIGKYPGGVVVSVINNTGELKKISECPIDSMTFFNPKDNSENIKFIGGLDFNSTLDQVKSAMEKLGFKDPKVYEVDKYVTYRYFEDNDSKNNYSSYIEFKFYDDVFNEVTLSKKIK